MWQGTIASASVLILANLCFAVAEPIGLHRCGKLAGNVLDNDRTWMAKIYKKTHSGKDLVCDGAIIHPRAVMVPRDCTLNLDTEGTYVKIGGTELKLVGIIRQQDGPTNTAILVLKKKLILGTNVQAVSLPELGTDFDTCDCLIASSVSTHKDGTETRVISKDRCVADYNEICTRHLHTDHCGGDGILVCPKGNDGSQFVLAGIHATKSFVNETSRACTSKYYNIAHEHRSIKQMIGNFNNLYGPEKPEEVEI